MRRLSITALLAGLLLVCVGPRHATAETPGYEQFAFFGAAFKLFPHIHQHGPLYNYGPYYGYYPFKPYGPWDAYLRYDPFFYGDPYANWGKKPEGNLYDQDRLLGGKLGRERAWTTGAFWHASWLQGGWFRGHVWLTGGHLHKFHKGGCTSCGGISSVNPVAFTGDATARLSGFGTPTQSAVFYSATPTLDPALDLLPVAGKSR